MALRPLEVSAKGEKLCPICGRPLILKEGEGLRIIDGQVDMESSRPRYECFACDMYFKEVLDSGYYDEFPLEDTHTENSSTLVTKREKIKLDENTPIRLMPQEDGKIYCPRCANELDYVEGGAVRIVHGKLDMDNIKGRYECNTCKLVYREILNSKYYLPTKMSKCRYKIRNKQKEILPTSALTPLILKKDENGKCTCPRCGKKMDYIEGSPVKIIDGKPDMENVLDHFKCSYCDSIYRRIVQTDYFQWSEK